VPSIPPVSVAVEDFFVAAGVVWESGAAEPELERGGRAVAVVAAVVGVATAIPIVPIAAAPVVACAAVVVVGVGAAAVVVVVAAVGIVDVVVVGPATTPISIILLALLRAECQLLLELGDHVTLLLHLCTQFRESLAEVLDGVLRGRMALGEILDDAVEFFVGAGDRTIAVLHAAAHVARDFLEF
jgi:hypothetical protein